MSDPRRNVQVMTHDHATSQAAPDLSAGGRCACGHPVYPDDQPGCPLCACPDHNAPDHKAPDHNAPDHKAPTTRRY
jgi:hypothetical protein